MSLVKTIDIDIKYKHDFSNLKHDSELVLASWGLSKNKSHNVVDNFKLDLYYDKVYYFYGYSGSGKSSILEAIAKNIECYYIRDFRETLRGILKDNDKLMVIDFLEKEVEYETRLK